jgi:hypothetical protein
MTRGNGGQCLTVCTGIDLQKGFMEKILLVLNARQPDMVSIDYACFIASVTHSALTGLFIENLFEYVPSGGKYSPYSIETSTPVMSTVKADTTHSVRLFRDECMIKGIQCEVLVDKGEPIQEAIYESRFADLLFINPSISFYGRETEIPSHLVKEILMHSECPVLLTPKEFEDPDEIIFCYDGSPSSVFSMKQFTYLLPEFGNRHVMFLEVNKSGKEQFDEKHRRMMEWLRAHYNVVYYHALKGEVKDELFNYFFMKRKKMIVMGAYGRSALSNFFKRSNADVIMATIDLPLFISHH